MCDAHTTTYQPHYHRQVTPYTTHLLATSAEIPPASQAMASTSRDLPLPDGPSSTAWAGRSPFETSKSAAASQT